MTPDPHFPSRLALQLSARPTQYNLTSVLEFEDCKYILKRLFFFKRKLSEEGFFFQSDSGVKVQVF